MANPRRVGWTLPVESVAPGISLLVAGPPMTGKYELVLEFVAGGDVPAAVVSTNHIASRVREDVRRARAEAGTDPDQPLAIVDCVAHRGDREQEHPRDRLVGSSENLTRIGMKFGDLFDDLADRTDSGRVGFHSVSDLLHHNDLEQVHMFLQVLTGRVQTHGWLGACTVDDSAHEERALDVLKSTFDGLVETREEDGTRQARVRGLGPEATDWTAF